jgi:hypothetical protein
MEPICCPTATKSVREYNERPWTCMWLRLVRGSRVQARRGFRGFPKQRRIWESGNLWFEPHDKTGGGDEGNQSSYLYAGSKQDKDGPQYEGRNTCDGGLHPSQSERRWQEGCTMSASVVVLPVKRE